MSIRAKKEVHIFKIVFISIMLVACIKGRVDTQLSQTQSEGELGAEDRMTPLAQSGALTNREIQSMAQSPQYGHLAYDTYRQLLSELAWNQPSASKFTALGISQAPADFIRESATEGKAVVLELANGVQYLDHPRFQALLRQLNLFLITSRYTTEGGAANVAGFTNVRDVPARLRDALAGNASADFGGLGIRWSGDRSLKIILNLANVSELRARQAISWFGAHVLSGDFYGVRELGPTDVLFIPSFRSTSDVRELVRNRFGRSAQLPDGLSDAEIDQFMSGVMEQSQKRAVADFEVFSTMPFLWNWDESFIGAWPKAVHRRLGIDTIRSLANLKESNFSDLSVHVRDYRDATRLLQQWENTLEPRSGLERLDLSLLPLESGAIDVNAEEGNFEITAKMPVAPVLRKVLNPNSGKMEFVETLIDLSFSEKKALLADYAKILGELHGKDSVVIDVSDQGGSHGHSLVIKFLVKVRTDQGEHEYTVELDGQSREYKVEEGEFKLILNTVRGGSLEAVGGKQRMTQAYLLLRFFAAEQMGLFPLRQSGGGHLTTGLQSYFESENQRGNARALARMFWLVHRFQGVFAFMVMDPGRVKGAIPFHFSPKVVADQVPAEHEIGRRPFKHIDELLTFTGSMDEFMKRLVDSRYFCDRSGRKMKYLFMNMLQALGNYLDPQNIGPDFDIKKGLWFAQAPVKGNRFTRESRGLDAPKDAFDAMLQLRLWRAIDAWALSDRPVPNGIVSQETYLEYGKYARNPDLAIAEFNRFMQTLGMDGGFDRLYEMWLWRRINEVQVDINNGSFIEASDRLRDLPRQFEAFGPAVRTARTSAETQKILEELRPETKSAQQEEAQERRRSELIEQSKIRERELSSQNPPARTRRAPDTAINPDIDRRDSQENGSQSHQHEALQQLKDQSACEELRILYEKLL